ncbi:MAG TPA: hypothetical protein VMU95_25195 [Trebonia sp.]|nr:hypothetical protein [Trebonia sp.]
MSLKGAFRENQLARAAEGGQPSHHRHRHRGGAQPADSSTSATSSQSAVPSTPPAVPVAAAEAAGLPVPEVASEPAGLPGGEDLAAVSVSASPAVSADCDPGDRTQVPVVPRIPQQSDRRAALDGERRPHFQ